MEQTQNKQEIILVDGLYSNEVSDKAPEYILGSLSVQPEKLALWLQANLHLKNEKGYINLIVKRSKTTGKRYISVDTFKKKQEAPAPMPAIDEMQYVQEAFDLPEYQGLPTEDNGEWREAVQHQQEVESRSAESWMGSYGGQ